MKSSRPMAVAVVMTLMVASLLTKVAQADMPPEQWLKMRQSGFSTDALSEYMQMKGGTGSSLFPMPSRQPKLNREELEKLAHLPLVGTVNVIGNGKWFHVDWPAGALVPNHVVILGPNRLIVSEAVLKSQQKREGSIRARYRIPDAFINLKRYIPTFAVSVEKLAELTYHPTFNQRVQMEDYQTLLAKIDIDPRIGRVQAIGEKLSAKWERDSFAPKEFSSVAVFNKKLQFSWGAFRGKGSGHGRFILLPSFGSVLMPKPGDYVVPLELASSIAPQRGEVVFNKVKPPLKFCNLFGRHEHTKVFPKLLFPGLYHFGITAGGANQSNVVPLCYVIVRGGVAIGVDFAELKLIPTRGGASQLFVKQLLYHHYKPK